MPPSCLRVSLSLPSGLHPTDVCTSTCLPIYYPVLASLEDDDVIPTGSRLSDLRVVAEVQTPLSGSTHPGWLQYGSNLTIRRGRNEIQYLHRSPRGIPTTPMAAERHLKELRSSVAYGRCIDGKAPRFPQDRFFPFGHPLTHPRVQRAPGAT